MVANPVEAWVVQTPDRWPGVVSLPSHVGTSTKVRPPRQGLFGRGHEASALPESSLLQLHVPPVYEDLAPARYRALFQSALDAYLATLHARPGSYTGRESAKRLDPFSAPKGARCGPSFGLIPALTNATKERRTELKEWRANVRATFYRWQVDKTAVFPEGTWQVVKRHKARIVA